MLSSKEFTLRSRRPHTTNKVEPQGQPLAEFDILISVWGPNNIVTKTFEEGFEHIDSSMFLHSAELMLFVRITVSSAVL